MEELRALVKKYSQVIQRYYVQYLSGNTSFWLDDTYNTFFWLVNTKLHSQLIGWYLGYDAVALAQMIQAATVTSEEDNLLLSSICQKISELSVDNIEDPDHVFDFRGLRLDWARLQVNTQLWLVDTTQY